MKDNLSIVITMLVFVVLIVIFPLYNYFERQDDMSYNLALKETTAFVDQVLNCGYIDQQMYNDYVDKLANTGNLYDIQLEGHQKVLSEESTDIYNEQYKIAYNKDIFDENGISTNNVDQKVLKNGAYYLNEGDQFYVRLKNTNTTMAGAIFNTIVPTSKKERIVVDYGGIVKNTAWNVVRQEYNALQYSFDVEVEIYLNNTKYGGNLITVDGAGRYLKGSDVVLSVTNNEVKTYIGVNMLVNGEEKKIDFPKGTLNTDVDIEINAISDIDSDKTVILNFYNEEILIDFDTDPRYINSYISIKIDDQETLNKNEYPNGLSGITMYPRYGSSLEATVMSVSKEFGGKKYIFKGWKELKKVNSNKWEATEDYLNEMDGVSSDGLTIKIDFVTKESKYVACYEEVKYDIKNIRYAIKYYSTDTQNKVISKYNGGFNVYLIGGKEKYFFGKLVLYYVEDSKAPIEVELGSLSEKIYASGEYSLGSVSNQEWNASYWVNVFNLRIDQDDNNSLKYENVEITDTCLFFGFEKGMGKNIYLSVDVYIKDSNGNKIERISEDYFIKDEKLEEDLEEYL